jgi:hypothetical protein
MVVLVDYSVLMHQSWNQIFTDSYEPKCKTEVEEYTRNLSSNLFYLKKLFGDSEMIICMDADFNWRASFVADYYESRLVIYEDTDCDKPTYYYPVDDDIWKVEYQVSMDSWMRGKLRKKAERDDVLSRIYGGDESVSKIENLSIIKSMDLWNKALKHCVPYYKGQRTLSSFKGTIGKSQWKRLSHDLAPKIASMLDSSVIRVDFAEGDDCIAVATEYFVTRDPNEEVVVVSVDQDLYQLKLIHPNLSYYNPTKHEMIAISNELVRFKLFCKMIGGDGSDNIRGVMIDGKNMKEVTWTQDGAIKNGITTVKFIDKLRIEDEDVVLSYSEINNHLDSVCEDDTFYKNLILVYLRNIPDELRAMIKTKIANRDCKKIDLKWKDLYLDTEDRIAITNRALVDSKERL